MFPDAIFVLSGAFVGVFCTVFAVEIKNNLALAAKGAFFGSLIAGAVLFSTKNEEHKREIRFLKSQVQYLEKQIPEDAAN